MLSNPLAGKLLSEVCHLCPPLSNILLNMYQEDVQLFIDGEVLLSQKGTTQNDPLAMHGNVCSSHHTTHLYSQELDRFVR